MSDKTKKILIVTYYWLPHSGTGTYRISKFVKYLIKYGWEPVILTTKNTASVFKEDDTDPVYNNIKVYRSKILEPTLMFGKNNHSSQSMANASIFLSENLGFKKKILQWIRLNLFIPDAKILWKKPAVQLGKKIIKKEKPDIILSTAPPPTAHLIAERLSRWSHIKWIADFRDPWTNIYYYEKLKINPISKKINQRLEKRVLKAADKIINVSDNFFPNFNEENKIVRIENGYDPDEIPKSKSGKRKNKKFTIRYIGSLKRNQFFQNFIDILKEISQAEKYQGNIKLEIIGYIDPQIKDYINKNLTNLETKTETFIPHKEAIQKMAESDLLILAIGQGKQSKNVISTKIFEYMMTGKPVLAFGDRNGSANKILRETNIGKMFNYDEYKEVKDFLITTFNHWENNTLHFNPNQNKIQQYSFENLTQKLINVLKNCMDN
ncbi:MAG: glycosyltransferase family 4 protein [Bacteroidales bacterium]